MFKTLKAYLLIARDVTLSPIRFFRGMSITEGIRQATYYALIIYYIRSAVYFLNSYNQGYFLSPRFQAIPPVTITAAVFTAMVPFLFLMILYSQSIFLARIGNFFGGAGNLEGAYKIIAFVLFLSLFQFIPIVNIITHIYAIILLIIGVKEVFNVDWISSMLSLFFSFIFTAFLYIILFIAPSYLLGILVFKM